jgi:hypothetical protein
MKPSRIEELVAEALARGEVLGHSVAVRLGEVDYQRLRTAAIQKGVAASTLARILIVTGVEALESGQEQGRVTGRPPSTTRTPGGTKRRKAP